MEVARTPSRHAARRLATVALVLLFVPPLWVATSVSAAPGNGWGTPYDLKEGGSGGNGYYLASASDRVGGAIALYMDWDAGSGNYHLYARRYVVGFGWQSEVEVDDNYAYGISIDANAGGTYAVAYVGWTGSVYAPRMATFSAFDGWSTPVDITGITSAQASAVAVDGAGQAYSVWQGWTGSAYQIFGTTLRTNGVADAATRLDNSTAAWAMPDIDAAEGQGAMVVWQGYNGTNYDCFSDRHSGAAWQGRRLLEIRAGSCDTPKVAMADDGSSVVIWGQSVNYYQVWTATASTSGVWASAQYTYTNAGYYDLALNGGGTGVMVTVVWNGSTNVLAAHRYIPGQGFSSPFQSNFSWGNWDNPNVQVDARGNAYASADNFTAGGYAIPKVAVFAGTSWVREATFARDTVDAYPYAVHFAPLTDGSILATWYSYDSSFSTATAYANLFRMTDTTPPWVQLNRVYDGAVTSAKELWISGNAEPGSTVVVNGKAAQVYPSGYFQIDLALERGGNYVSAQATDAAGLSTTSNTIYLTSTDPQALLDAERRQAGRGGFLDPMDIESINYWGAWWPIVKTDRNGNAFAIWYEYSGSQDHAYVARYTNGSGWGTPILLQAEPAYLYGPARIAVDAGGNATIMFAQQDYNGAYAHVYAWFYTAQYGGFSGPYRIDVGERFAWWPDVAVNPATGLFTMVWHQRDENSLNYGIWSRNFTFWVGFGSAVRIENVTGSNELGRIAFDAAGRGYVGFRNWNGSAYNAAVARFNGTTWNQSFILAANTPNIWNVPTAADAGGNATFAWHAYNGSVYNNFAARIFANGTVSAPAMTLNVTWDWDPEIVATNDGRAFIGYTADRLNQNWNGLVAVSGAGTNSWTNSSLDLNTANPAGGVKLSKDWSGTVVRAHFDESYDGIWHAHMREYNVSNGSWGPIILLSKPGVGAHIPDVAPMPDGGLMTAWDEDNTTLGFGQIVARRVTVYDTTPPALTITSPSNGSSTSLPSVELRGTTEVGARVWVNNIELIVALNGTFVTLVPVVNGTNTISVRAQDMNGVWNNKTWVVTFNDPAYAMIANLTQQNQALQNQLNATNASLWAAIAAGDASLLAQLIAQNASLLGALDDVNSALLADLAAQNTSLAAAIASGDAQLAADLASQNAALLGALDDLNSSLLADLTAQNTNLLTTIAATNSSLLAKLAAQNASVTAALSNLNATLLAQLASQDAQLTQLIADTNATLLAELASQNDALTDLIASTNTSLLASLAAQNGDLLLRIASTNASLLAQLASQNATLWAKLTADNGALWTALNGTNHEVDNNQASSEDVNSNQNATLASTRADVEAAKQAAASAGMTALLGLLLGLGGIAVAGLAIIMSRKRPPSGGETHAPPPHVEDVQVVEVAPAAPPAAPAPHAAAPGHSMGAEGELTSAEA